MKDLKIFLFSFLVLIFLNFSSFAFASVEWVINNETIAPLNNFFLNITWKNSTAVGEEEGYYKLNNITFNLTNTTGSLSLIYIYESSISNIENLTFNLTNTSTSSLLIWGNDTVYTTQTEAWFAFNISAPQAGLYEITVEEAYSNGANYITNTSTLLLTIKKAPTEVKLYFNGTEGNKTYVRGQVAHITATVNITGKNVTIVANFGSLVVLANGTTPQENLTNTSSLAAGEYDIIAYFVGDGNYTESSKTYWLRITLPNGASCTQDYQCAGGYCVHGTCRSSPTYCGDGYCDSGETCSNCQVDCGECPTPSYRPSKPRIIVNTEPGKGLVYLSFIKANEKTNITFEKRRDLNVFELNILITNKANSVSISITKLDKRPAEVQVDVVGRSYRYLKITKENLRDQDISQAKIKFFVEKSWINENNIDPTTIALYRFSDNKWNRLTTNKLGEDSNYVYYEAETPGFSYFAIAGEPGKQTCPFECCVGEANYYDKVCASGYRCENRRCLAVAVCEENWVCGEWSECVQGWQTRTCRDINNCGTTQRKPIEAQSCAVPTVIISTELIVGIVAIIILVIGVLAWKFVRKKGR